MATEKIEEVPSAEPSVEEAPKESVEEKLSELKIEEKAPPPDEQPPAQSSSVETAEEKEEETAAKAEETAPVVEEAAPEPKVLEVVETVDTQTRAPDATTEPASREVPTEVVHETTDAPHKPTLVEKITSIFHHKST